MSKINIIKFVPYFPPHKGGLESHVQERSQWRVKKGYGEVMNVVPSMGQEVLIKNEELRIKNGIEPMYYKKKIIGYRVDGYSVLVYPAFDLIPTFPFPKFWKREFWIVMKLAKKFGADIVNTHTRFFLTSLMGGIFAKLTRTKRIHIEHGVDYVKLANRWKSSVAWLFDQIIGRWIFRCSSGLIGISYGCKRFMQKFTKRHIDVVHRGMNFVGMQNAEFKIQNGKLKIKNGKNIKIGFVGRVVKLKGLDLLVEAFHNLQKKHTNLTLEIVGDGDQLHELQDLVKTLRLEDRVSFLGSREREYVANEFLPHIDIVVNPSYQEGLPTSVVEGLLSKCVVVATDVGGTNEISDQKDLILVNAGDVKDLQKGLEYAIENHKILKGLSYESVKDHFDWRTSVERYYSIYQKFM